MRIGPVVLLIVLAGLTLSPVAQGQEPLAAARAQLMTALFDSTYQTERRATDRTERDPSLSGTHLHLRRLMNCMEGPRGKNFTVAAGNPCQGQGSGILNDLGAAPVYSKGGTAFRYVEAAHGFALQGLTSTDAGVARTYAWMVAFDLNNALDALK